MIHGLTASKYSVNYMCVCMLCICVCAVSLFVYICVVSVYSCICVHAFIDMWVCFVCMCCMLCMYLCIHGICVYIFM